MKVPAPVYVFEQLNVQVSFGSRTESLSVSPPVKVTEPARCEPETNDVRPAPVSFRGTLRRYSAIVGHGHERRRPSCSTSSMG